MDILFFRRASVTPPGLSEELLQNRGHPAGRGEPRAARSRPGSERFLWWTWEEWWVMGKHTWGVSAGEPGVRAAVPWRPRCDGQSSDVGWAGLVPGALGSWLLLLLPAPRCQQRQRWCLCTTLVPTQFNANHDKAKAISRWQKWNLTAWCQNISYMSCSPQITRSCVVFQDYSVLSEPLEFVSLSPPNKMWNRVC